ncbi:MAG: type 4a pilus biogenesis protein PilO [Candidatus Omnitrophota bacterium]
MNLKDKIRNIKIFDRLDLDNKKIILIAVISAIALYMDVNLVLKAQVKGLNKGKEELIRLNNDLDSFKAEINKMRQMESARPSLPQPGLKAKKTVPENQFPSLLQDIFKAANNNAVRILQIRPYRQAPSVGKDNKAKPQDKLTPVLIALELSCGYHNLGKFINGLENLEYFVNVQEIKIEPQGDNYLNQKVSLLLTTYTGS